MLAVAALLSCSSLAPSPPTQPAFDVLIRNGRIVDGSGNPWLREDLAVVGDRIAAVGRLDGAQARLVIDAHGMIVAPGFIDMLGQSELGLLIDPRAEGKLTQGITTEVTGEGASVAPLDERTFADAHSSMRRYGLRVDWHTLDGYFGRLQRSRSALNVATYVGATQVRALVLGEADRPPTDAELDRMKRYVEQAMRDGALGLSSALVYAPAAYASTEELIELAKVAARYGGIYATHLRSESTAIMTALDEAIRIGREANIPVEVFHLKVAGKPNWGQMVAVVRRIEEARAAGVDITANQYPYTAAATSLRACLPPWAHEGGRGALLERLKDPKVRARLKAEMRTASTSWENFYLGAGGGQGILVTHVDEPSLVRFLGVRLTDIARTMGRADELDALFDLVIADNAQTGAIYFMMDEDDVKVAMKQPWVSIGTDTWAASNGGPLAATPSHPRGFGSFPRILGRYVREQRVLTLEEAVRKMTSLPANRVGLTRRGLLKPGFFADIVIFDPELIVDSATFEAPYRPSVGVKNVLVNGQHALRDGLPTGVLAGRPLRGPGYP